MSQKSNFNSIENSDVWKQFMTFTENRVQERESFFNHTLSSDDLSVDISSSLYASNGLKKKEQIPLNITQNKTDIDFNEDGSLLHCKLKKDEGQIPLSSDPTALDSHSTLLNVQIESKDGISLSQYTKDIPMENEPNLLNIDDNIELDTELLQDELTLHKTIIDYQAQEKEEMALLESLNALLISESSKNNKNLNYEDLYELETKNTNIDDIPLSIDHNKLRTDDSISNQQNTHQKTKQSQNNQLNDCGQHDYQTTNEYEFLPDQDARDTHEKLKLLQLQDELSKWQSYIKKEKERNKTLQEQSQDLKHKKLSLQAELRKLKLDIIAEREKLTDLGPQVDALIKKGTLDCLEPFQNEIQKQEETSQIYFKTIADMSTLYESYRQSISSARDTILKKNQEKEQLEKWVENMYVELHKEFDQAEIELIKVERQVELERKKSELLANRLELLATSRPKKIVDEEIVRTLKEKRVQLHDLHLSRFHLSQEADSEMEKANIYLEKIQSQIGLEKERLGRNQTNLEVVQNSMSDVLSELEPMKEDISMYKQDIVELEQKIALLNKEIRILTTRTSKKESEKQQNGSQDSREESRLLNESLMQSKLLEKSTVQIQRWWKEKLRKKRIEIQRLTKQQHDQSVFSTPKINKKPSYNLKHDSAIKVDDEHMTEAVSPTTYKNLLPVIETSPFKSVMAAAAQNFKATYKWDTPLTLPQISQVQMTSGSSLHQQQKSHQLLKPKTPSNSSKSSFKLPHLV